MKNRREAALESPISFLLSISKRESFEAFKKHMEQAMLFRIKDRNRQFAINRAIENSQPDDLFVEFGVAGGQGSKLFGGALAPHGLGMTGFDSFEGLEEDWTGSQAGRQTGAFDQGGALPDVPDNVTLVKGWIQDTLTGFIADAGDAKFRFIHMDMDTYTPTLFSLEAVKPKLVTGTVILFDELYGYPGWRHHEYKALQEVLAARTYKYISFSGESVAIEML